jgi:hypothetical protein
MRNILIFCGLLLIGSACDKAAKAVEAEMKATMDIHDEAMKDMADMNRAVRQTKEAMTRIRLTEEGTQRYNGALLQAEKAESDMMAWMQQYEPPSGKPAEEALAYLAAQKTLISKNRDDIRAAIATLQALPNEAPQ